MASNQTNADGFRLVLSKVTKAELARNLGLTRQAINKWGDEVPERFAVQIAGMTGIPAESILPETYRQASKLRPK
jgi:hypothetical protein